MKRLALLVVLAACRKSPEEAPPPAPTSPTAALGGSAAPATPAPPPDPSAPRPQIAAQPSAGVTPTAGDYTIKDFAFASGEKLPELRIHYMTLGTAKRDAAGHITNAVLVMHGTGGSGKQFAAKQFADVLFRPGQPLDVARYYIILPDDIGHGESSKPSDGLHARFPHYGYGDLVDLQHKLVTETLGVAHLHAILGMSMGGMNAWQWAEAWPDSVDGIMPVVAFPMKV